MSDALKGGPGRVGQVKEVTSLANPIIKDIKNLSQKKGREETGTFMAEGLKLVIDALELGWSITTLVYAKNAKDKPLVTRAAARTVAAGGIVVVGFDLRPAGDQRTGRGEAGTAQAKQRDAPARKTGDRRHLSAASASTGRSGPAPRR